MAEQLMENENAIELQNMQNQGAPAAEEEELGLAEEELLQEGLIAI